MHLKTHNPTPWLQHFGLNHAVEVRDASRTVYFSGQTASDAAGTALYPGDLVAQFKGAWACLCDALAAADMTPANLVRMNIYTTDVDGFMATADQTTPIYMEAGSKIACTLLGVTRLYDPTVMIELEATAVA
ncbi:MAG: RidA family protein [Sphingomonadales bacterium]|nr:RidA family protein [Sphingomonadales bacterium]NCQ21306.1 RidA family protein [Sphingomonadales bacterium]NCT03470.1 RidA family protein [Sphingomonadales bacterium]